MTDLILPIAMSVEFWNWERLIVQIVMLAILSKLVYGVRDIILQEKLAREARGLAIDDVRQAAEVLAQRTAELSQTRETATTVAAAMLSERLDVIDHAIESNTQMTTRAADASANAAEVANSMNTKIDTTNKRLLEHIEQKDQA